MKKTFAERMRDLYGEIETQYRPDLRWWLAEGLNTDETLRKNVRDIHDSGFGAAEFLAMPEPGADSSVYGWGSEEWTSDTRLIIEESTRLGLGFSLTCGAHWANANLPDTYVWRGELYSPDSKAAAQELDYATVILAGGEAFNGKLPLPPQVEPEAKEGSVVSDIHGTAATYKKQHFQGVVAVKVLESRQGAGEDYAQGSGTGVLDAAALTDLTDRVSRQGEDYTLNWTAPEDGTYALFAYWMHGTSQTASPSVSTNYTINYVDSYGIEALIDYWEEIVLTGELKETIRKNGRGEIYMDSLELLTYGAGGIYWGHHLREEFQKRKKYDILPYLPLLTMNGIRVSAFNAKEYDYSAGDQEGQVLAGKVRADFYSVLSDLYLENVLKPLQEWLHSLGMTLRAEPSYGMPYEISTPAKYIDGIETESFAQVADPDLFRGILGSANMYGRVFSSETGAVFGRNYYYNMDDWTQLCYLQFAAGVSRTVFHGYSAIEGSEEDTYWPGHEGMYAVFSERFNRRQPASLHYPTWTRMLGRNQKVLRQGVPARDIAILRTDYFFINYGQPKGYDTFADNYFMHDIPHFWKDTSLQQAGYTYDYFSPLLLTDRDNIAWNSKSLQPDGPAYKAVILYQETLELCAAKALLEIAKDGLPILFVNDNTEILSYDGTNICHGKAASSSKYRNDGDSELQEIVAKIKALPNVMEVDNPSQALSALKTLGVQPRVAYGESNRKILTYSRRDTSSNIFYTFAYSYKFELEKTADPYTFTMCIEGEGVPYHIDDWTGDVKAIASYEIKNGCTNVTTTLKPGEAKIIALDLSGSCSPQTAAPEARLPEPIILDTWDIEIEDWNEGNKVVNTEEKFGHVTKEVYYTTKKTKLTFQNSKLMPWKDLPATAEQLALLAGENPSMAHVSGIGSYKTSFKLPENWDAGADARLCIESAGGGSVEAIVNGKKLPGVNIRTLEADIGGLLKAGENTVVIQVATTLTNRMLQRNYRDNKSAWTEDSPTVQSYGLTGTVKIV